jgi:hypothetical protein
MTVAELLSRTTSRELSEWMVYYELEPFGEERGDLRAGIVASTVANVNRDPKKQKKPYSPQDFLPKFDQGGAGGKAALSPEALRRKWEMVVAAFGGGEKKK